MMWLFGIVAVLVIGFSFVLSTGRLGEMPELRDDHPVPRLPEGDFDAESLAAIRFATTTRGYHRGQVDALLKRAGENLNARAEGRSLAPSEVLDGDVIRESVFDVVSAGYLMSQVDAVLERLARQFDAWDPAGEHVSAASQRSSSAAESVSPGEYLGQRRANSGVESVQSGLDAE